MKNKIIKYLRDLEVQNDIKILLACETGSRAWGFPSPDSDYDVRIIYVHNLSWYVGINEHKDSIDLMFEDNEIDISGWELRKSLRLLTKSNGAMLERIQSDQIYFVDEEFQKEIDVIADSCYSRIATIYHYSRMSKNCLETIKENDNYKLKKLFYALRSAVACKWILEKNEKPPISFLKMLEVLELPSKIKKRIYELIEFKSTKNETYLHSGDIEIIDFIQENILAAEAHENKLPSNNYDVKELNTLLMKYASK